MTSDTMAVDETLKTNVKTEEVECTFLTPAQIQHRFDTLRGLSDDQMKALNKKLVRKIDWRLMPCITVMFLMK
jgi:hypothetical protein